MLKTIKSLHDNGFCHHNITPENIYYVIDNENNLHLKLSNF
jgi:hypothetical protein